MLRLAALIAGIAGLAPVAAPVAALGEATPPNTCVRCHGDLLEDAGGDVHRAAGLSCADCHHGNPAAEDQDKAMSRAFGFVGAPKAGAVAQLCGSCHADIERMRAINPRLPTDQLAQYRTSHHGKRAAKGDARVATCVSCHGAHGVRSTKDPASPASKGRIVKTCTGCHNATYMAGVDIPKDQLEKYERSVHGRKRLVEQDLAAPACNDCHGNHGAAPPGLFAVTHVCGRCHVTQAELFAASGHAAHFKTRGAPPCTTCHSNHEIVAPSDEMLGTGPKGTCKACHQPGDRCDLATGRIKQAFAELADATAHARESLAHTSRLGMDVEHPTFELAAADDAQVRARVEVHAFAEDKLEAVVAGGRQVAAEVERAAAAKLDEYQFRRKGLAAASVLLLLLAGLLIQKARRLEKARPSD